MSLELTTSPRALRMRAYRRELFSKRSLIFFLFISPWILGFLIFTVRPMIMSLYYSFTKYKVIIPPKWVGLSNYQWLLKRDVEFDYALKNTLIYSFMTVPLRILAGLIPAIVLNHERARGLPFWRALFYLPTILPAVASTYMFAWFLSYRFGPPNILLRAMGLPPMNLFRTDTAILLAILFSVWGFGGPMIILLAGLKGIPQVLYEAARIDGANNWHCFRHVTWPGLSPVLFFLLTNGLIRSMQAFQVGWFLIDYGAPRSSLVFLGTLVYENAFGGTSVGTAGGMGYASAVAWFIFALVMALTAFNLWTARHWVHYEQI